MPFSRLSPLVWFLVGAGFFWAEGALAVETFTFSNAGAPELDGVLAGATMTKGAITLTSVDVSAPLYTFDSGTSAFLWDGTTFTSGHRTNISSPDTMGINNQSLNSGAANSSENQHIDPGESWTFKFNVPVVFKVLDMSSMHAPDLVKVTINTTPAPTIFNFVDADFPDGTDNRNDPFGTSFVIPAQTDVTLFNATPIVATWLSSEGSGEAWRIGAFVVEQYIPPGDFDNDGDVDGADFIIWQTNHPLTSGADLATGDADGDDDVDGADFAAWQGSLPTSPGPGLVPIPEPGSMLLTSFGLLILGLRRRGWLQEEID